MADAETRRVFNMGVGFAVVAAPFFAASIVAQFEKLGVPARVIGAVWRGSRAWTWSGTALWSRDRHVGGRAFFLCRQA